MKYLLSTLLTLFTTLLPAQIELPKILTDHAVVQRNAELPVRGRTTPATEVTIRFREKSYQTRSDAAGKFRQLIATGAAGGPFELSIATKKERRTLRNLMVGDVWLCGGQSNMEWTVKDSEGADEAIAGASDTSIRHFKVPRSYGPVPKYDLPGGAWAVNSPEALPDFTAVGYFFAQHVRAHHKVPIGLLNSTWGGSRIEPWMSETALGHTGGAFLGEKVMADLERKRAEQRDRLVQRFGDLPASDPYWNGGRTRLTGPIRETDKWHDIKVPGLWEEQGIEGLDGIVYFKTTIDLPAEYADLPARLGLAKIDDSDWAFVNGTLVGQSEQAYARLREYEVPAGVLRPGRNQLTVRVEDTGGGGGIYADPEDLYLEVGDRRFPLAGTWKMRVATIDIAWSAGAGANQLPTIVFNEMIAPIQDFPIAGVLWYQGESNAGSPQDATQYADQFKTLIQSWRKEWNRPTLPFYWVQLANFMPEQEQPVESDWARLRQSQHAALELPHTAEAVIIDIGEAGDIHPRNKHDVGDRLARAARHQVYGEEELLYSGPTVRKAEREGAGVKIHFDHAGTGLTARRDRYGYLRGFALRDADGNWHWAQASLKDVDTLLIESEAVKKVTAVRYAWADNPADANLYNSEGLPASPFEIELAD